MRTYILVSGVKCEVMRGVSKAKTKKRAVELAALWHEPVGVVAFDTQTEVSNF